ncbi:MAG: DUF2267 domain-containing protein [Nocardiaceae bacterium]|nr:DUF2267 domain-containing protein [Nocardiaceae bacterium]
MNTSQHHTDPFAAAVTTAQTWMNRISEELDTEDPTFAYRATRAWLHAVRDQLPVSNAVRFSAQLPELLRGVFFEGWKVSQVPRSHDTRKFVASFAKQAGVAPLDVADVASAITAAFDDLLSPGQFSTVFRVLPEEMGKLLRGGVVIEDFVEDVLFLDDKPAKTDRVEALEERVAALTDAVTVLVKGLEELPTDSTPRGARAAQEAHRILIAENAGVGPAARA